MCPRLNLFLSLLFFDAHVLKAFHPGLLCFAFCDVLFCSGSVQ